MKDLDARDALGGKSLGADVKVVFFQAMVRQVLYSCPKVPQGDVIIIGNLSHDLIQGKTFCCGIRIRCQDWKYMLLNAVIHDLAHVSIKIILGARFLIRTDADD